MNKSLFLSLFLAVGFCSCSNGSTTVEQKSVANAETVAPVSVPVFNQDSAYKYISEQCAFGPRVPNTKEHEKCLQYLKSELERLGGKVELQKADLKAFDGTVLKSTNVISSFYPERNKRVVLFSHWDSRPFSDSENKNPRDAKPVMGANDGASGVGVLMEVARNIVANDPKIGVDIVLFDSEDYGAPHWKESQVEDDWCLGSQFWSKNTGYTSANKPRVGILLDMVGANNARFSIDAVSEYFAGSWAQDFWKMAGDMGFGSFFSNTKGGQIIDDHYYVNSIANIPTFDIIDYKNESGFPEMWHTQHDDVQHIDKNTLGVVGRALLRFLYVNCAK